MTCDSSGTLYTSGLMRQNGVIESEKKKEARQSTSIVNLLLLVTEVSLVDSTIICTQNFDEYNCTMSKTCIVTWLS